MPSRNAWASDWWDDRDVHVAAEVHAQAAALYVAMLKNGYLDEAADFAEWYLEEFDHDLET